MDPVEGGTCRPSGGEGGVDPVEGRRSGPSGGEGVDPVEGRS